MPQKCPHFEKIVSETACLIDHFATLSNQDCETIFNDRIFKPGLLFFLSTWTRPTFDHSEVKIDLYDYSLNRIVNKPYYSLRIKIYIMFMPIVPYSYIGVVHCI